MRHLLFIAMLCLVGSSCSKPFREVTFQDLTQGTVVLAPRDASIDGLIVRFELDQNGSDKCPELIDNTVGSVNGKYESTQAVIDYSVGCRPIAFEFLSKGLENTTGYPDALFQFGLNAQMIRFGVRKLLTERPLTLLTDRTQLKPGGELRYSYGLTEDQELQGSYRLFPADITVPASQVVTARIDAGQLVATLPASWSPGDRLHFTATVKPQVAECQGIAACDVTPLSAQDDVLLP